MVLPLPPAAPTSGANAALARSCCLVFSRSRTGLLLMSWNRARHRPTIVADGAVGGADAGGEAGFDVVALWPAVPPARLLDVCGAGVLVAAGAAGRAEKP